MELTAKLESIAFYDINEEIFYPWRIKKDIPFMINWSNV